MIRRYLFDTGIAQDFQDDRGNVRSQAIGLRLAAADIKEFTRGRSAPR
jgi:hypothetical protein